MSEVISEFPGLFVELPGDEFGVLAVTLGTLVVVWRSWRGTLAEPSVEREYRPFLLRVSLDLIAFHDRVYEWLCGAHPHRRPWHCQWLSVKDIYRDLGRLLPAIQGQVLDVGCSGKPYATWMPQVDRHVGVDVFPGDAVDHLIREGERWPLETESFQSALCTQVFQVVRTPTHLIDELHRVLVPGGTAIIATPFCFRDMSISIPGGGIYKDYWRHSVHGVEELVSSRFEILELKRQGGVGSTVGIIMLNWILFQFSRRPSTHLVFAAMLPIWLPFCMAINMTALLFDKLDTTGAFYHNVIVVLRKPRA